MPHLNSPVGSVMLPIPPMDRKADSMRKTSTCGETNRVPSGRYTLIQDARTAGTLESIHSKPFPLSDSVASSPDYNQSRVSFHARIRRSEFPTRFVRLSTAAFDTSAVRSTFSGFPDDNEPCMQASGAGDLNDRLVGLCGRLRKGRMVPEC